VTRREFEAALREKLDETVALTRKALADAGLAAGKIRRICLVGGSTRIPLVRSLLEGELGVEVHEEIDADLAVGLGAAVQAGLLAGEQVDRILVDVAAHTLGIRAIGDRDRPWDRPDTFAPVLRRNTVLPAVRTEEFYTVCDDQEKLDVEVFQGESPRCTGNAPVGSFTFELAPAPELSPVHVAFAYDLNGVVKVSVSQPGQSNARTVALAVADAGSEAQRQAEDPVVMRKARAMLAEATLEPAASQELEGLVAACTLAAEAERPAAEDALLDFILEHEDLVPAGAAR
jgi:molecular chaperone DnaK